MTEERNREGTGRRPKLRCCAENLSAIMVFPLTTTRGLGRVRGNVVLYPSCFFSHTFIKSVIIHVSIHVQVLSSHKGELCLRVLIGSIVGVITEEREARIS